MASTPMSFGKILVVSPHFDDAVFSCGEFLAQFPGAVVVTVCAAIPQDFGSLTKWDALSGFQNAEQAVTQRRLEDRAALDVLAAQSLWLDFYDSQYERTPSLAVLTASLQECLRAEQPDSVFMPAGLYHSDHVLVHQAMLAVRENWLGNNWFMYEDAVYRRFPGLLQKRLASVLQAGLEATPLAIRDTQGAERKRQAVQCYSTQLAALAASPSGYDDVYTPEQFWHLDTVPQPKSRK